MLPAPLQGCSQALQQWKQAALQQEQQQLPHALSEVQQPLREPGLELWEQRDGSEDCQNTRGW